MSIQKKSLINTLKTTKKANIVKEEVTVSGATVSPFKLAARPTAARTVAARKAAVKKLRPASALRLPN
jgi:hypothetical protein